MSRILRTLALVLAIVSVSYAAQAEVVPLPRSRPHFITLDSARVCLAAIVYFESRGEPELGRYEVAFISYNRARLNEPGWGGPTVCGVALSGQFSGITKNVAVVEDGDAWDGALGVADTILYRVWEPPRNDELRYATHYLNPATSDMKDRCWFERTLIPIAAIGRHVFYREPLSFESPKPSPECYLRAAHK